MPRSRPLLPLTFTQHPEGEELPPPFPSSAPRPCRPRERRSLLAAPPLCLASGSCKRGRRGGPPVTQTPAQGEDEDQPRGLRPRKPLPRTPPPPALLLLNPHSLTASPIQSGALQPAARPKITPGAILKLQGGTVPAPDLRLCLSSQHKPATSMCVSADARPRKEERAGGREGGRGRAQVHVPPVNWEPPLPYCTQTAPPITSQPCRLVSHSTGLGLGGREGPRGRWAWVHVCV